MSLQIVRANLAQIQADAIVSSVDPDPGVIGGVSLAIQKAAGPDLARARQNLGWISPGWAEISPAYGLPARFVIHAVGPVWQGGGFREAALLKQCYVRCLDLALAHRCQSIAFPLICAGSFGFPRDAALKIARDTFREFLRDHEMQITLAVFDRQAFSLSVELFDHVKSYIDDAFAERFPVCNTRAQLYSRPLDMVETAPFPMASKSQAPAAADLSRMLAHPADGFSETLLRLIDRTGKKDSEIYKKANVDRKLFSKIRSNPNYKPSKATALAFAIALELDLEQTRKLLETAGFALSRSSKADIILEYFIMQENYDIFQINETLFAFDQPLLGQ